jgi:sulfate permease, SulP family
MNKSRFPLPLVSDLRVGGWGALKDDVVAGLTTVVVLIPQGMAYALLAGLPPVVGLYAAFVPPVGYALVGSSRELSVGPVAMDSLLVLGALSGLSHVTPAEYPALAAMLALLVGVIQVVMGVLGLGYFTNFLSQPVLSGFTSGAAVLIALSQVGHLLGIHIGAGSTLVGMARSLNVHGPTPDLVTLGLSAGAIGFLLIQKKRWPRVPGALIVIVVSSWLALSPLLSAHIAKVGAVPPGLPHLEVPRLSFGLVEQLWPSAALIALVGFMESIAVGRVYAKAGRYPISPDRELWSLGFANVLGSLFQAYPVAGGFSRTAVNARAGARSTFSTLVASLLLGMSLLWATPLFALIPKAALASVVVTAVVGLVDVKAVRARFRVQRSDGVLLVLTFVATLGLGILKGLLLGVAASVLWVVVRSTRPHLAVLGRVPGTLQFKNVNRYPGLITYDDVLIVRMDAQLYFANSEFLRDKLIELEAASAHPLRAVIIDASPINHLDSSAVEVIEELEADYKARGVRFYLAGVKGPVRDVLERAGLWTKLKNTIRCMTVHEALEIHHAVSGGNVPHTRAPETSPSI